LKDYNLAIDILERLHNSDKLNVENDLALAYAHRGLELIRK